MRDTKITVRDGFEVAGLVVIALLLLPLAAVAVIVARFAFFAIALVGVAVGLGAWALSPRFRSWLAKDTSEVHYSGLRLAGDVALSPEHAWARFDGGEATVGADDLVQNVLGPVEAVELPLTGVHVRQGDPLFRLDRGARSVTVRAPISGRVLHANPALADDPRRVNDDPYGAGWAVRLLADGIRTERRALKTRGTAASWFRGEVDRLLDALVAPPATPAYAGATMADGGVLVHEVWAHIDDPTWDGLQAAFFGAPAIAPIDRDVA